MKHKFIYFIIIGITFLLSGICFIFFPNFEKKEMPITLKEIAHEESLLFKVGEEEEAVIRELIITMARTNPAVLAFKKSKLEALGAKLKSKVTTFEFLAVVFSDKNLAKEMKLLQESTIKYKRFVEVLAPKMMKEYEKADFYLRVEHFALHLEIDEIIFTQIINNCLTAAKSGDRGAFKPLIDYLITIKNS